jgi:hypothetical protein
LTQNSPNFIASETEYSFLVTMSDKDDVKPDTQDKSEENKVSTKSEAKTELKLKIQIYEVEKHITY